MRTLAAFARHRGLRARAGLSGRAFIHAGGMPIAIAVCILVLPLVSRGRQVWASPGDGTIEPSGRGSVLLGSREAVLSTQSENARRAARARTLALYRMLRFAVTERRAGPVSPVDGRASLGGRAVALATAVLERDLAEARLLRGELDRVRIERAFVGMRSGPGWPSAPKAEATPAAAGAAPLFVRPVDGALVAPFGVGRDGATGALIFRAAAEFSAPSVRPVRCPADGRVVRVADSVAGGVAVVLAHQQGAWTTVVSGLAVVAVPPGAVVRQGDDLGRGVGGPGATVRIEIWRGRTPIDPVSLFRSR